MQNIEYKSGKGFARIEGVDIWVYPPKVDMPERGWRWSACRYAPGPDGYQGAPLYGPGIGEIQGQADTEEEAIALATSAARLVGCAPSDLVSLTLDTPVPYRLVAVADGPDERVET